MTEDEQAAFMNAVKGHRLEVLLALATGMRSRWQRLLMKESLVG